jgi:hypothetical protein
VGSDLVLRLGPGLAADPLWAGTSEVVLLLGPEGRVERAEGAAEAVLGLRSSALVGRPLEELLEGGLPAGGPDPGLREARALGEEGRPASVLVRLGPPLDGSGGARVVALSAPADRGLPEGRRAEARRLEEVGAAASRLAHDLNNLLTVTAASAGLLAPHCPASPARELVGEIAEATRRCATLTGRMLSLARHGPPEPVPVDPDALLARVERMARRLVGPSVVVLREAASADWRVLADETALEQALLNLAANARDAMPRGGALRLASRAEPAGEGEGGTVRLSVTDTGAGMTEEVRARAFETFFTTKPAGRGTGLGLASVRELATSLGGSAELDSAPGAGTTVTLVLPAIRAGRGDAAPGPERAPSPRAVLVVDGDPALLRVVGRGLGRRGFQVSLASDAAEARRLAAERGAPFDHLVLDLDLPGGEGRTLAAELAGAEGPPAVLRVSGMAAPEGSAGEAVLAKPFTVEQLADRLAAVPGGRRPASGR